jgi:hypothetical protein
MLHGAEKLLNGVFADHSDTITVPAQVVLATAESQNQ